MLVRSGMVWVVAALLLGLPWLEFWVTQSLGLALPVVVLQAVATGAVGWYFARQEGLSLWTELESDIQNHRVPTEEGLDAMLVVLAGWGLIIPGVVTDVVSGALLAPPVRRLLIAPIRQAIRDHLI